ncbi:MAG: TonB-dependent receptor, partial [Cytophagales bacterium]|nr:TonB-dependent receptor [Cytophagales bacterium]
TRLELAAMSSFKNQSTTTLDRWTPGNTDGSLPIAVFGDPNDNDRASSRWVEDGSFLKIRELTLAYNLPGTIMEKLKMEQAKVYLQGRNFFTHTDYSGYDPEVSRDGGSTISPNIDYGTFPQVQSFLLGLNVSF